MGSVFTPDAWLVKIDSVGNIQWKRLLGGSDIDRPYKVHEISPGRYITDITTLSTDSMLLNLPHYYYQGSDSWICIFDSIGNITKEATLPWWGSKNLLDFMVTKDKGFIFSGIVNREPYLPDQNPKCNTSDSTQGDFAVFKLDSDLNIQWCWIDGGEYTDKLISITALSDTSFLTVGTSTSPDFNSSSECLIHPMTNLGEGWMFSFSISGQLLWKKCFSGSAETVLCYCLHDSVSNDIYLSGGGQSTDGDLSGVANYGESDEWIIKMSIWPNGIETPGQLNFEMYPNPASDIVELKTDWGNNTSIQALVYDIMGKQVLSQQIDSDNASIGLQSLSSGIYFLKLQSPTNQIVEKLIKR